MLHLRHAIAIAACAILATSGVFPATAAETGFKVPVSAAGVSGAFWVSPPLDGLYTCPMDPDVHANEPGTCPKCHMDLVPVPTKVKLVLPSSAVVAGRTVRLGVVGNPKLATTVKFNKGGAAECAFVMPAGSYTLSADLVVKGRHVKLSAPYVAR